MSYSLADRPITVAEFDAFVDAQPWNTKCELIDGRIVATTNPIGRHGQIVANLGFAIKPAAVWAGCKLNFGGLRVQASAEGTGVDKTIPDLTGAAIGWAPEKTFAT